MTQQSLYRISRTLLIGMSLMFLLTGFAARAETIAPVAGEADPLISISSDLFSERVAHGLMVLEDKDASLDIEGAIAQDREGHFEPFSGNNIQLGYSDSVYWIKLRLQNNLRVHTAQNEEDRFFVSVDYPLLDNVEFFHIRDNGIHSMVMGDIYHFTQRYFDLNHFVYPLAMKAGEQSELYIRVFSNSSLSIPLHVETERAFINRQFRLDSFNGIYLGVTLGLCLYNLFLWVGIRKAIYALYVVLVLNLMMFNLTILGFAFRLWPGALAFQQQAIYLFSFTSGIAVIVFGMVFLKTKVYQPNIHKILMLLTGLCTLCVPALLILDVQIAAKLTVLATLITAIVLLMVAFRSIMQGYRPARYYAIGQGAVIVSVMFTALTSQKVIPLYHLAPDVMKWCSAFELLFFSFGLADLVNSERRKREEAQKESARAQQELLNSQIKLNEDLDTLVRERTEELEEANQRLRDLNTKDELTGLRNRRFFNEIFPTEYRRAFRDKSSIAVLMIDIDYFKQLNDTHGHQFGDVVLQQFSRTLQAAINRPPDIAIRYGGEEFIVLLPNTHLEGAQIVAENIRKAVANDVIEQGELNVSISVSIGVAAEIPIGRDRQEILLRKADDMLYQAKENGRNRIECENLTHETPDKQSNTGL